MLCFTYLYLLAKNTGEVIISYNYKLEQMDRCMHELSNRSPFYQREESQQLLQFLCSFYGSYIHFVKLIIKLIVRLTKLI